MRVCSFSFGVCVCVCVLCVPRARAEGSRQRTTWATGAEWVVAGRADGRVEARTVRTRDDNVVSRITFSFCW